MKTIRFKLTQWQDYKQSIRNKNKLHFFLIDTIEAILVALIMALIIRSYVIQVSMVPTGSMIPTMQVGDRLFVSKFTYRFKEPVRGEIVVFKSPYDEKKDYVKRCIGLPGETIEVKRGVIFVDGNQLVFPGVNVQRDYSFYGPTEIPEGHYFMMGDNRGNSLDSRVWGFVPEKDLVGKALFTFWPIPRMQVLR